MFAPVPFSPHPPFSTHRTTATYTLVCDVGTFTLSGQDAGLIASRNIVCDVGIFSLAGQDANFVYTAVSSAPPQSNSGGYPESAERVRTRKDVSAARSRLGITDELARQAIAEVAARQAERLEMDRQKQFDELRGELELQRIEWDASYLEALASEREALIGLEIARRLRERLSREDEEALWLLVQIAAQVT